MKYREISRLDRSQAWGSKLSVDHPDFSGSLMGMSYETARTASYCNTETTKIIPLEVR